MPNRVIQRCVTATHSFWYRLTGGLVGGRFGRAPVLLLTTIGRKSGRPRTTPLLYLEDGDNLVVVASNGGSPRHPTWYLNLKANPRVVVQTGSRRRALTAETAGAEGRQRLWPKLLAVYGTYEDYQRRTSREIPLVVLRPSGEG